MTTKTTSMPGQVPNFNRSTKRHPHRISSALDFQTHDLMVEGPKDDVMSLRTSDTISLERGPTPEAIAGLSQELEDLERTISEMEDDTLHTLSNSSSKTNLPPPLELYPKHPSQSFSRLSKEASMAKHLIRENAKLRRKVDKLEYELSTTNSNFNSNFNFNSNSQSNLDSNYSFKSKPKLNSNSIEPSMNTVMDTSMNTVMDTSMDTSTSMITEDLPIVISTLKSKLNQSELIISQQRSQLESQDIKLNELELKLREYQSTTNESVDHQLNNLKPQLNPTEITKEIILIDGKPTSPTSPTFSQLSIDREDLAYLLDYPITTIISSPTTTTTTTTSSSIPIYSTGNTYSSYQPHPPSLSYGPDPKLLTLSPMSKIKSYNQCLDRIAKSISLSSLHHPNPTHESTKSPTHSSFTTLSPPPTPTSSTNVNALQATVQSLEAALQSSYSQHTSLHTTIHRLQSSLQLSESTLTSLRHSHSQATSRLIHQLESVTLESHSYQRQLSDATRLQLSLQVELERATVQLQTWEESKRGRRSKFRCF